MAITDIVEAPVAKAGEEIAGFFRGLFGHTAQGPAEPPVSHPYQHLTPERAKAIDEYTKLQQADVELTMGQKKAEIKQQKMLNEALDQWNEFYKNPPKDEREFARQLLLITNKVNIAERRTPERTRYGQSTFKKLGSVSGAEIPDATDMAGQPIDKTGKTFYDRFEDPNGVIGYLPGIGPRSPGTSAREQLVEAVRKINDPNTSAVERRGNIIYVQTHSPSLGYRLVTIYDPESPTGERQGLAPVPTKAGAGIADLGGATGNAKTQTKGKTAATPAEPPATGVALPKGFIDLGPKPSGPQMKNVADAKKDIFDTQLRVRTAQSLAQFKNNPNDIGILEQYMQLAFGKQPKGIRGSPQWFDKMKIMVRGSLGERAVGQVAEYEGHGVMSDDARDDVLASIQIMANERIKNDQAMVDAAGGRAQPAEAPGNSASTDDEVEKLLKKKGFTK